MVQISFGLGNRLEVLEENVTSYRRLLLARLLHQVFVVLAIGLVKISICMFLLRLVTKKLYVWFLWGMVAFMSAFTIASVLTIVSELSILQHAFPSICMAHSITAH